MIPLDRNIDITENGEYGLTARWENSRQIVEVAGDFGGGTITVGYQDALGEFAPYLTQEGEEYTATEGSYWDNVPCPPSGIIALKLAGATDPEIRVRQSAQSFL